MGEASGQKAMGFIAMIAIYGVVNLLLYGAQEIYHSSDKQAYATLLQEMEQKRTGIEAKRNQIQTLESDLEQRGSRIERLKTELRGIEQEYGNTGAPDDVYDRYERVRAEVNGLLRQTRPMFEQYDRLIDSLNAEVDAYNKQIPDLNSLGHRAFDRWVLIPIPVGRHAPVGELGAARRLAPVPAH